MTIKHAHELLLKSLLISAGSLCIVSVIDLMRSIRQFDDTISEIDFNDINKNIKEYKLLISGRAEIDE